MINLLREYKAPLLFIGKFIGIYFIGNLIYGIYVESVQNNADYFTWTVSNQTVSMLAVFDISSATMLHATQPKVVLTDQFGFAVINVFEGCNGINIMILFVAFLVAAGGKRLTIAYYAVLGIIIIHIGNLARIALLYWVATNKADYLYFVHKYIFTAIIYSLVFALWFVWIRIYSRRSNVTTHEATTD